MTDTVRTAHFWFDHTCPYTFATSRWLRDATSERGVEIRWHLMSLELLDDDADDPTPEDEAKALRRYWKPARVLAAAERHGGSDALGALYTELARRLHDDGRHADQETLAESIAAAALPAELIAAVDDDSHDAAIRASHADGQRRADAMSGTPVTALDDRPGWFGPIVVPAPTGAAALDLWDALVLVSRVPSFSELKRGRAKL